MSRGPERGTGALPENLHKSAHRRYGFRLFVICFIVPSMMADPGELHRELSEKDVNDPGSRADIVKICKALANELEDPALRGWDWLGAYVVNPALCILADLNIFEILKDGPKTSQELALATGADALLICKCTVSPNPRLTV